MEITLALPISQLELLFHLIKERTSKNMSHNNSDLSQAKITTKWVTREVAKTTHALDEEETALSVSTKGDVHINGYKEIEKPTISLEKKWKEARTALSDGQQILSLKTIAEIIDDVESRHNDKNAIEETHRTCILAMARCNRLENLYKLKSINREDYLSEKEKLYPVINDILEELWKIVQKVSRNTRQIVEFEIPSNHELDAQDLLSMIYEIADKLGIKKEEVVPIGFRD